MSIPVFQKSFCCPKVFRGGDLYILVRTIKQPDRKMQHLLYHHSVICNRRMPFLHEQTVRFFDKRRLKYLRRLDDPDSAPVRRIRHKAVLIRDLDRIFCRHSRHTCPVSACAFISPPDDLFVHERSDMWMRPSTPSSISTNTPKFVKLRTLAV